MTKLNFKLKAAAALVSLGLSAGTSLAADVQLPSAQFQPAMSFSFAINSDTQLNTQAQKAQSESNEYWVNVSAKQLREGVDVHTSISGALIKISRTGAQARPLDAQQLKLFSQDTAEKNIAGNIISEQDLKATGIFANATAIKMDKALAPGKFQLRYDGPLAKDGQFVIHVKEKYSPNKLHLSTNSQHVVKGDKLNFDAIMMQDETTLALSSVSAYIISPSGKKAAVPAKQLANGMTEVAASDFAKNLEQVEAPINGLYELHVNAVAKDKGIEIHRTGKIAFALAEQTASLTKQLKMPINPADPKASILVSVNKPGRYEVRGILYGHDSKGTLQPIMETHSAKNLESGKAMINMAFDQKLLLKSGLQAPFVLKQVRLYDQSRMSRL